LTYPILDATEAVDIVLINRPELPRPGPVKARSARLLRPSPTPSSTGRASAYAAALNPEPLKPALA
jgi:hypothetical protein